jgi:hypothetical protein
MIVKDPSPEAWNTVRRYASWMRQVRVDGGPALREDAFRKLRINSPPGGWFPALEGISWCITTSDLPYADLLFSPQLKSVSISVSRTWVDSEVPRNILPFIASTISALPTSALEHLFVSLSYRKMPWAYFKDSLSSVILRCGPSFTEFTSPIPLSDTAVNHLIRLPHLRTWRVQDPPPSYSASSLPPVFPPLTEFTLGGGAARGWISLFKRIEGGIPITQGTTPLSEVGKSLKTLMIENLIGLIDVSFTSPIQIFWNLVNLNVEAYCHDEFKQGQCNFKLNNDHVAELAMALPQLELLLLGRPCFENSCATTVACLLPISIHCIKLHKLEIHFNTTNIINDLKDVLEDPLFQELRSLPRCKLSCLNAGQIPLVLDTPGFETVANGMINIFPSLDWCNGRKKWYELSERIEHLREVWTRHQ